MKREIIEPLWLKNMKKSGLKTKEAIVIYIKELIIKKLSESEFKDCLFLENMPEKTNNEINYYYSGDGKYIEDDTFVPGAKLTKKFAESFFSLIQDLNDENININGKVYDEGGTFEILIGADIFGMYSPIELRLMPLEPNENVPEKIEYTMLSKSDEKIIFFMYPVEVILSDIASEILSKLELMYDMEKYSEVFRITQSKSFDGTKFSVKLLYFCKKRNVPLTDERLFLFLSYRNNNRLKARWNRFIKHNGESDLKWEELMGRMAALLGPVWDKLCNDDVFTGDWMPELGRYLA